MNNCQTEWLRQVIRKETRARYAHIDKYLALVEQANRMSDSHHTIYDTVVKVARASIPSNPNTIFDVGNMQNPCFILQDRHNKTRNSIALNDTFIPKEVKADLERAGKQPRTAFEFFKEQQTPKTQAQEADAASQVSEEEQGLGPAETEDVMSIRAPSVLEDAYSTVQY